VPTYTGSATSAEWAVEAPSLSGVTTTLGDHTPNVTFRNLAVNTGAVGVDQVFMVQGGAVMSSPSAMDLTGFTVAYEVVAPGSAVRASSPHAAKRVAHDPLEFKISFVPKPGWHEGLLVFSAALAPVRHFRTLARISALR